MQEKILDILGNYPHYVSMGLGVFILIGSVFDWKWITNHRGVQQNSKVKAFIKRRYGDLGVYNYERCLVGLVGILFVVLGILIINFKKM